MRLCEQNQTLEGWEIVGIVAQVVCIGEGSPSKKRVPHYVFLVPPYCRNVHA